MLVVFAKGMTWRMCANAEDGRIPMGTVLAFHPLNDLDVRFRARATRDWRTLEMFTKDGHGSARIGLRDGEDPVWHRKHGLLPGVGHDTMTLLTAPGDAAWASQRVD